MCEGYFESYPMLDDGEGEDGYAAITENVDVHSVDDGWVGYLMLGHLNHAEALLMALRDAYGFFDEDYKPTDVPALINHIKRGYARIEPTPDPISEDFAWHYHWYREMPDDQYAHLCAPVTMYLADEQEQPDAN